MIDIKAQVQNAKRAQTVMARLDKVTPGKTDKSRLVQVVTKQVLFQSSFHVELGDVQGTASFLCPSSMIMDARGEFWLPCWFVNKKIQENAEKMQGSKVQKQRLANRAFGGETALASQLLEVQV